MEAPNGTSAKRATIARRIRRVVGAFATLTLMGVIAAELFAWLLPQQLENDGHWYVCCVTISFFVRVFQLHVALGTIVLGAILLAARWRWVAFAALVCALSLLAPYARDFAPKHPPAVAGKTLRLMSINLYFHNENEQAIMRSIDDADPDVLVLVEVTPWSFANVIHKHLLERYQYVVQPPIWGVGTVLSRVPFRIGEPARNAGGSFGRSPVVFDVNGTDVALYAVHLVSPGHAWLVEQNRKQVAHFAGIAAAETRPMVIVGDCNFTQLTPNAAALHRAGFRSSHELVGLGLGNTWGPRWWPSLDWLPGVRIDHIWLSPRLTATSQRVGIDTGSDHRPIIAEIGLTAPAR